MSLVVQAFLLLLFGLEAPLQAYIDPGSGSLVLQAAIGIVTGAAYYFRGGLSRLLSLLRLRRHESDRPTP
jgi:hypothetical protein